MIVALTPSPALDRTVHVPRPLRPGALNRVGSARETAGGKGMNVVRAVHRLGGEAVGAVPLAGENGRTFAARAGSEGLRILVGEAETETRCCTIVTHEEPAHPTEINEPGSVVCEGAWRELLRSVAELQPDVVVVSGTMPPGTEPLRLLETLTSFVPAQQIVVDGSGETLAAALQLGVKLVSPNTAELEQFCRAAGWAERGRAAAARVHATYGVEVLLSDGQNGAGWFGGSTWWARLERPVAGNPIGSGDTLLGAFLLRLLSASEPAGGVASPAADALRFAVAAAAANVRAGGGALIDPAGVDDQLPHVAIEEL